MMNLMGFLSGGNFTLRKWSKTSIVADGNSNTINSGAGTDSGSPYTVFLMEHLAEHVDINTVTMHNIGVGGQTTVNMLADFESQVEPLYDSDVKNLMLMWEIGNDLYLSGNVETVYNRTLSYCQNAAALGFYVIVATCPTRIYSTNTTAGDTLEQYNAKIEEVNSLIRENIQSFGTLADIAADWRFRDPSNTTYFQPDGIHFSEEGRRAIAEIFSNAMKKVRL